MRKIILAVSLALITLSAVGCTQSDIKANEDKAKAIFTAVNNGARMAVSVVREGIDAVCANAPTVAAGAIVVRTGLQTQSGANTTQNLANLDKAVSTLNDVCTRVAANPNDPDIRVLLQTAWTAYQSAKAAQNKAIAAGG